MWPELLEGTDCRVTGVLTDAGGTVLPAGGHRAHS